MKCNDCKGTGKYVGIITVENCAKCSGSGREATSKREVMEDVLKFSDVSRSADQASESFPRLNVGTTIHVYDGEWIETIVRDLYDTSDGEAVLTRYSHGSMHISTSKICWNLTKNRYEYIRSGTPVYS